MKKTILDDLRRSFDVSRADMRRIMKDFHLEMDRGLSGKKSSLKMLLTYVDRPTGREKGSFIALDLGGTNFRVLALELKGRGRMTMPAVMKFALQKEDITGSGGKLFDFLASSVKTFLQKSKIKAFGELSLGFTFSFPVKQKGVASGTLVTWTKGFEAKGICSM